MKQTLTEPVFEVTPFRALGHYYWFSSIHIANCHGMEMQFTDICSFESRKNEFYSIGKTSESIKQLHLKTFVWNFVCTVFSYPLVEVLLMSNWNQIWLQFLETPIHTVTVILPKYLISPVSIFKVSDNRYF